MVRTWIPEMWLKKVPDIVFIQLKIPRMNLRTQFPTSLCKRLTKNSIPCGYHKSRWEFLRRQSLNFMQSVQVNAGDEYLGHTFPTSICKLQFIFWQIVRPLRPIYLWFRMIFQNMVPEIRAERTGERCGQWILGTQFLLLLSVISDKLFDSLLLSHDSLVWIGKVSLEARAERTGKLCGAWISESQYSLLFADFNQGFDRFFCPSDLSHDSAWFFINMSLSFMLSVQVNGAAHESPGHSFPTSICKL